MRVAKPKQLPFNTSSLIVSKYLWEYYINGVLSRYVKQIILISFKYPKGYRHNFFSIICSYLPRKNNKCVVI